MSFSATLGVASWFSLLVFLFGQIFLWLALL